MIVFTDVTAAKQAEVNLQTLNNQLTELATTDALTGLSNRRAFDQALDSLTQKADQTGEDLALLMIDVDCFKSYNDTYGHPAGDACLQMISHSLAQAAARYPEAVVARYGGEEIAVILPSIQEKDAVEIALHLCEGVRRRALPHSVSEKGIVTVSIGVAMHSRKSGRRREDLVKDADLALYDAKALGRDQVRLSEQLHAEVRSMRH
jgi:diguanylate cyclase (GGDEF)-like protein